METTTFVKSQGCSQFFLRPKHIIVLSLNTMLFTCLSCFHLLYKKMLNPLYI